MYEYFIALYFEKKLYLAGLIVSPALSADKLMFPVCRLWPIATLENFGKSDQKPFSTVQRLWEVQSKQFGLCAAYNRLPSFRHLLTPSTHFPLPCGYRHTTHKRGSCRNKSAAPNEDSSYLKDLFLSSQKMRCAVDCIKRNQSLGMTEKKAPLPPDRACLMPGKPQTLQRQCIAASSSCAACLDLAALG